MASRQKGRPATHNNCQSNVVSIQLGLPLASVVARHWTDASVCGHLRDYGSIDSATGDVGVPLSSCNYE